MKTKHALKIKVVLALLIAFVTYSCGGSSAQDELVESSNYKLEIVDSLQFDILTPVLQIADVDPKTGNILVIQRSPTKAIIFNSNMEILVEKEFLASDPKGPGASLMSGTFFGDGVAFLGRNSVSIFNGNLVFQKVLRPHYASQMFDYTKKDIYEFTTESGEPRLVTFFGEPQTEFWAGMEEFYDEFNIVDVVDPAQYTDSRDTVFMPIGGLTSESRYRNGKAHYFLRPIFDVKKNVLYYTLHNDTTFFKRKLPEGEIIESYKIPFDEYIMFQGYSMGEAGEAEQDKPRDREGRVESVYHLDGFDVIFYHSGMKLSQMMNYRESPDPQKEFERIDYKKYLVIKDGKRVNLELKLNPKIQSIQLADENGFLYGSQNTKILEEEPEKYTIYKLRIVPDEN
ncbi:hypothetical protein [uncultured Roseivirga sp.]|uniref:hypothetical protein n=1 Tax=uncultured Roseivirga sp. TaxID=543088 RepID=UPI000D78E3E3|nr:hypothetical protein [uncultured Roseivirga sp.]PWL30638.1 MAG: hypothetical protein DCO95_03955 [Roseivirga sp. XM-24bin3]